MKFIRITAIAALMLCVQACGYKTIDTGNAGIPLRFGQINGEVVTEGLHFYNPFTESIKEIDVHVQKWEASTESYTKDVQEANISFVINYQLRHDAVADTYKKYGENWANRLVGQAVLGSMKDIVGQWDAVDLVQNREKATAQIRKLVTAALAEKNIDVSGFQLTNIEYSPAFNHAIEAKVIAQQSAIKEQNHTEEIKQIANQQVITATAEAQSMTIRAQALEKNPKLVEWEAVQKWNGQLPSQMFGGAVPFINVSASK